MIIGLTGTYCAGKNHIAALLEAQGLPVLDVDKLGYKALESEKEAIFAQFADDFKKADASWQSNAVLDRRLLGQIVFKNAEKLAALEAIVHPIANKLTDEWIASQKGHCVINAALLHRSSVFSRLDRIILVKAPLFTRFLRAHKRDKLPFWEILRRFSSQKNFNTQYLSINAEIYIIENPGLRSSPGSGRKLKRQIDKLLEGIN